MGTLLLLRSMPQNISDIQYWSFIGSYENSCVQYLSYSLEHSH